MVKNKDGIKLIRRIASLMFLAWIISWFAAIWMSNYVWQLFFTGLFSLIISRLIFESADKLEKKK